MNDLASFSIPVHATATVLDKVSDGSTPIVEDTRIYLQHSEGQVGGSFYAKNELDASISFDRTPTCDKHRQHRHTASGYSMRVKLLVMLCRGVNSLLEH